MSLTFIDSNDTNTGNTYDDSISFPTRLQGSYKVIRQCISLYGSIAWIWDGVHHIHFKTWLVGSGDLDLTSTFPLTVEDLQYSVDHVGIANSIETKWNAVLANIEFNNPGYGRTVTVVYTASTDTFDFTFDNPISMLWSNSSSTWNECVGKKIYSDESDQNNITSFSVTAKYINEPEYLEMYIAECDTYSVTSHQTYPTMFLNVNENEFTGQYFTIPVSTDTLTFQLFRPNVTLEPCPITKGWHLALEKERP